MTDATGRRGGAQGPISGRAMGRAVSRRGRLLGGVALAAVLSTPVALPLPAAAQGGPMTIRPDEFNSGVGPGGALPVARVSHPSSR